MTHLTNKNPFKNQGLAIFVASVASVLARKSRLKSMRCHKWHKWQGKMAWAGQVGKKAGEKGCN